MNETVTDGILKVAGGTFLTIIAMIIIIGTYAWIADRWERVMNYRKAHHLQDEVDDLRRRLDEKYTEIRGLRRELEALRPKPDKEERLDET